MRRPRVVIQSCAGPSRPELPMSKCQPTHSLLMASSRSTACCGLVTKLFQTFSIAILNRVMPVSASEFTSESSGAGIAKNPRSARQAPGVSTVRAGKFGRCGPISRAMRPVDLMTKRWRLAPGVWEIWEQ